MDLERTSGPGRVGGRVGSRGRGRGRGSSWDLARGSGRGPSLDLVRTSGRGWGLSWDLVLASQLGIGLGIQRALPGRDWGGGLVHSGAGARVGVAQVGWGRHLGGWVSESCPAGSAPEVRSGACAPGCPSLSRADWCTAS